MIKKTLALAAVILLVLAWTAATPAAALPAVAGHRIAIDPGHGGETDVGSTACPGLLESQANLDIALRLRALLEANGATVYLTRDTDVAMDNHERAEIVNATDAEVLVNLHLNGWEDPTLDGLYVFFGRSRKDRAFAQVMHDAMWEELQSTETNFVDFGVRQFAAGILLWSDVPSALTESVFISNEDECAWLQAGTRQDEIVEAVYAGLNAWFAQPPVDLPGKGP